MPIIQRSLKYLNPCLLRQGRTIFLQTMVLQVFF